MKTMLSLFLLFLTFTAKPLVGAVDAASDAVLDADGDEVQTGASYYIMSANISEGGVALPHPYPNHTCHTGIILLPGPFELGLPVAFSPVNTTEVIRESTDLNFNFSLSTFCEPPVSAVWKVDNYDPSTGQWFVIIDGVADDPGPHTLTNWFKIEKSGVSPDAYNLVYCPSVCVPCVRLCSYIGTYVEDGVTHLALSKFDLFSVVFVKAGEESANKRLFSVI